MNIDKLRKIKTLAESGGMEASAAQQMLERLIEKYGISDDELDENKRSWRTMTYSRKWQMRLWLLVSEYVLDAPSVTYRHGNRFVEVELSDVEWAATQTLFAVHAPHVEEIYLRQRDRYNERIREAKESLRRLEYVADGYAMKNKIYRYATVEEEASPTEPKPDIQKVYSDAYHESDVVSVASALLES